MNNILIFLLHSWNHRFLSLVKNIRYHVLSDVIYLSRPPTNHPPPPPSLWSHSTPPFGFQAGAVSRPGCRVVRLVWLYGRVLAYLYDVPPVYNPNATGGVVFVYLFSPFLEYVHEYPPPPNGVCRMRCLLYPFPPSNQGEPKSGVLRTRGRISTHRVE